METGLPAEQEVGAWDFVLLDPLTEEAFIDNLYRRYKNDQIYTYIGNELVSINPYKNLNIYSSDLAKAYLYRGPFQLPPHIFAVIGSAYRWLRDSNEDQCIILSGESGSGKTEASKMMTEFLSCVTNNSDRCINLKEYIIHTGHVLEAFGNAVTVHNDNASRFGKYIEIEFDYKGDPTSAAITTYLLEKFRVTNQSFVERNFHIFFQLLSGADVHLLKLLKLQRSVLNYAILRHGNTEIFSGRYDKDKFLLIKNSLKILQFSPETIAQLLKIVSVVLKFGNLIFISTTNIDGTEGCAISNDHELYEICELLETGMSDLQTVITSQIVHITSGNNSDFSCNVTTELSAEDASYSRDCLCMALYNRLFMWLVKSINNIIKIQPHGKQRMLGLLDIYGFEKLEHNGFQQLIINFCNERLQQVITESTLHLEQEEYIREGLEWTPINYRNDFHNCNLIERNGDGLLSLLDEICENPSLTNETTFLRRLSNLCLTDDHHKHCEHSLYNKMYNTMASASENLSSFFKLKHFAGVVTYDCTGFIAKNKDNLRKDLSAAMYRCNHPLLKLLFPEGNPTKLLYGKQPSTASKQFRIALNGLVRNLNSKRAHYIHCIKPNEMKQPHIFEPSLIQRQIRYHRLLETVRIRRSGFCYSLTHSQFLNRYKMLSPDTWPSPSTRIPLIQSIQYIICDLPIPVGEFAFGTTKVFVRSPRSVYELEDFRHQRISHLATIIQNAWKKYYYRQLFLKIKRSQKTISSSWKSYKVRSQTKKASQKKQVDWAVEVIQRHYIQWKRYQFLLNVIQVISMPETLSPINQKWPTCSLRLASFSMLLRKLHHHWRCQKYRSQFDQTSRNKMREKTTAAILFKNRKCCYLDSVPKPFLGDYIRLKQSIQWKKICSEENNDQYIVFADIINKITRSSGKFVPALMVISTNSVLIVDQRTLDVKYRIPATEIYRLSVSPYIDNIAIFHIHPSDKVLEAPDFDADTWSLASSYSSMSPTGCLFVNDSLKKKGDFILQTAHIIEVITKLFLVIQNAVGKPPDVNIATEVNACFNQQIVTISFRYSGLPELVPGQLKIIRKGPSQTNQLS